MATPIQGLQGPNLLPAKGRQGRIQFSLAGVQMKFTANLVKDRVTFPALEFGGNSIAETTSKTVPEMVEAEQAGMVEGAHDLWPTAEIATDVGNTVRERLILRLQSLRLVRDLRPDACVQGFAAEEADDVPAVPKP
ncbi:hypothetical protein ACQKJ1_20050 [Methylorubrum rhodesianum]|uniref:hypothetical protein n=1 Tax=Methylorubrum rhodesianum TaxID=29427 RepID=UPI003D073684